MVVERIAEVVELPEAVEHPEAASRTVELETAWTEPPSASTPSPGSSDRCPPAPSCLQQSPSPSDSATALSSRPLSGTASAYSAIWHSQEEWSPLASLLAWVESGE